MSKKINELEKEAQKLREELKKAVEGRNKVKEEVEELKHEITLKELKDEIDAIRTDVKMTIMTVLHCFALSMGTSTPELLFKLMMQQAKDGGINKGDLEKSIEKTMQN